MRAWTGSLDAQLEPRRELIRGKSVSLQDMMRLKISVGLAVQGPGTRIEAAILRKYGTSLLTA